MELKGLLTGRSGSSAVRVSGSLRVAYSGAPQASAALACSIRCALQYLESSSRTLPHQDCFRTASGSVRGLPGYVPCTHRRPIWRYRRGLVGTARARVADTSQRPTTQSSAEKDRLRDKGERTCINMRTRTSRSSRTCWYSLALVPAPASQPTPTARPSWMASWESWIMSPRLPNVRASFITVLEMAPKRDDPRMGFAEASGCKCAGRGSQPDLSVQIRPWGPHVTSAWLCGCAS